MSIVNQMLRDLDSRCGSASDAQLAALGGLGLIRSERNALHFAMIFSAWALSVLLAVFIGYHAISWWKSNHRLVTTLEPGPREEVTAADENHSVPVQPLRTVTATAIATERSFPSEQAKQSPADSAPVSQPVAEEREPVAMANNAPQLSKPVRKLTQQQKADGLFTQAQQAIASGDYHQGELLLRQTLFEDSRHYSARAQLASLLAAKSQSDAAERLLAQGLVENSTELELAKPYAQLLAARGALDAALSAMNEAMAGGGGDAEGFALRAAILQRLERHAAAASEYHRAISQYSGNPVWWTGLAISEEKNGQAENALKAYRQAARLPLSDTLRVYVTGRIQALALKDGQ